MSLFSVMSVAASGMRAAQTRLSVAAENIANADTPGYRPALVDTVELSTGGVGTIVRRGDASDGGDGSGVDIAAEQVAMVRSATYFAANAAVVKTANRMLGSLLDIFDNDDRRCRRCVDRSA